MSSTTQTFSQAPQYANTSVIDLAGCSREVHHYLSSGCLAVTGEHVDCCQDQFGRDEIKHATSVAVTDGACRIVRVRAADSDVMRAVFQHDEFRHTLVPGGLVLDACDFVDQNVYCFPREVTLDQCFIDSLPDSLQASRSSVDLRPAGNMTINIQGAGTSSVFPDTFVVRANGTSPQRLTVNILAFGVSVTYRLDENMQEIRIPADVHRWAEDSTSFTVTKEVEKITISRRPPGSLHLGSLTLDVKAPVIPELDFLSEDDRNIVEYSTPTSTDDDLTDLVYRGTFYNRDVYLATQDVREIGTLWCSMPFKAGDTYKATIDRLIAKTRNVVIRRNEYLLHEREQSIHIPDSCETAIVDSTGDGYAVLQTFFPVREN